MADTSYFRQVVDGSKIMFSFRSRSQLQEEKTRSLLITARLQNPRLSEIITRKFSAYNSADDIVKFLGKLIAYRKFELAVFRLKKNLEDLMY